MGTILDTDTEYGNQLVPYYLSITLVPENYKKGGGGEFKI